MVPRARQLDGLVGFAADSQESIVLSMLTGHGRATPLLWKTVRSSTLKGNQRRYEYEVLCRLREVLPEGVKVTVVADRGFADCRLFYALKEELGFEYVIRLRGDVYVTDAHGERRMAGEWVGTRGRARRLEGALVTDAHELPMGVVVCVHAPAMDEPWCLVSSATTVKTRNLLRYYGKRWGIRGRLSRHQGHALRDGSVVDACIAPGATGPAVADLRAGDCRTVVARRGGRGPGL